MFTAQPAVVMQSDSLEVARSVYATSCSNSGLWFCQLGAGLKGHSGNVIWWDVFGCLWPNFVARVCFLSIGWPAPIALLRFRLLLFHCQPSQPTRPDDVWDSGRLHW